MVVLSLDVKIDLQRRTDLPCAPTIEYALSCPEPFHFGNFLLCNMLHNSPVSPFPASLSQKQGGSGCWSYHSKAPISNPSATLRAGGGLHNSSQKFWYIANVGAWDRRNVVLDSSDHGGEKCQKTSRLPLDFRVYNSPPSCSGPFGPLFTSSKMVSLASPAPAEPPAVAR
jgi:hypothetical protein